MSNFPLQGKLIDGSAAYSWLTSSLAMLRGEGLICSAFLKKNVLESFSKILPKDAKLKILTRWQAGDLLCGASDIDSYLFSKEMGWDFYIKLNFHGKVFSIPDSGILVGSANATSSGFSLRNGANLEMGTIVDQSSENVSIVEELFRDSTLLSDSLYEKLKGFIDSKSKKGEVSNWPTDVLIDLEKIDYRDAKFFVSECFLSEPSLLLDDGGRNTFFGAQDLSLLGIYKPKYSKSDLVYAFLETKLFKWAYQHVSNSSDGINFGGITALLHNALIDDPVPYRSEIKKLVQNLYKWIKFSGVDSTGIEIYQPNHTEILRLR